MLILINFGVGTKPMVSSALLLRTTLMSKKHPWALGRGPLNTKKLGNPPNLSLFASQLYWFKTLARQTGQDKYIHCLLQSAPCTPVRARPNTILSMRSTESRICSFITQISQANGSEGAAPAIGPLSEGHRNVLNPLPASSAFLNIPCPSYHTLAIPAYRLPVAW